MNARQRKEARDAEKKLKELKKKAKTVSKTFAKTMKTNQASQKFSQEMYKSLKDRGPVNKGEKYLDDLWEEYKYGVAKTILVDKSDKNIKEYLEVARRGWANKGRELEFKMFLISGNLKDFDAQDNFPAWGAGDLLQTIEIDGKELMIDAQIKGYGATFSLPGGVPTEKKLESLEKDLGKMLERFAGNTLVKAHYQSKFKEATQGKIKIASGARIKLRKQGKDYILKDARLDSLKEFMQTYVDLATHESGKLTVSNYLLMGIQANNSDLIASVPEARFLHFVEEHEGSFSPVIGKHTIAYKWTPTYKEPISAFIARGQQQFHVHSTYGQEHFSIERSKEFKGRKNLYNTHYDLLLGNPRMFEEPHLAFFGTAYKPIQEIKKKV